LSEHGIQDNWAAVFNYSQLCCAEAKATILRKEMPQSGVVLFWWRGTNKAGLDSISRPLTALCK
jgi:hypothetical protein